MMLSVFTNLQQSGVIQNLQMMRDGGLRQREALADLAAGKLSRGGYGFEHLKPLRISQRLQDADGFAITACPKLSHIDI